MSVSEIQLFQILKNKLGEKEAEELVLFVKNEVNDEFTARKDYFASKEDLANTKTDLIRSIYVVGLTQFLAIIGSVLLIMNYMVK